MPALQDISTEKLTDQTNSPIILEALTGSIILLNFWSAECPSCNQTDLELGEVKQKYPNLLMIAILSNQNEDPEKAKNIFRQRGYDHIWIDHNSSYAQAWEAVVTPTVMIFNEFSQLKYWGAVNDQTFRKKTSGVNYVLRTMDHLANGREVEPKRTQPYGCAIVSAQLI